MSGLWCVDALRQSASEGSESDEELAIRRGESSRDIGMRANAACVADMISAAKREASGRRDTEGQKDLGASALVQEEFISSLSFYTASPRERVGEDGLERKGMERDKVQGREGAGDTGESRMAQAQGFGRTQGAGGRERAQERSLGVDERVLTLASGDAGRGLSRLFRSLSEEASNLSLLTLY